MTTRLEQLLDRFGPEKRPFLGLENFKRALEAHGNPEKSVQSIVIAGTNGKGSTTLLVSAGLMAAGLRVGTYLSPHLQDPRERLLCNLVPLEAREIDPLANEILESAEKFGLSYFEFMTLLFFVWAERSDLDRMVVEVGLGGRLDATNVTQPLACVITNIDLDHQSYLGDTLPLILEEKMGILRPGVPTFSALREPSLREILRERCATLGSPLHFSDEVSARPFSVEWAGQAFELEGNRFRVTNPSCGMLENARLAYCVLRSIAPELTIPELQACFARVRNPGRMELVSTQPPVVLSGDHNPAGLANLRQTLSALPPTPLRILCAFSPDKPFDSMIAELKTIDPRCLLTQIPRFASQYPAHYATLADFEPDPLEAMDLILRALQPGETLLVTGSLYLVGEVRSGWQPRARFLEDA